MGREGWRDRFIPVHSIQREYADPDRISPLRELREDNGLSHTRTHTHTHTATDREI